MYTYKCYRHIHVYGDVCIDIDIDTDIEYTYECLHIDVVILE